MYRQEYKPEHPRADVTGHVGVHILVMEKKLGRSLKKGEIVHHCDFNKLNNDPLNLLLLSRIEHQQLPAFQAKFIIKQNLYPEFVRFWQETKDKRDPIHECEIQLVKLERQQQRLKQRIARAEKKERR